MEKILYPLVAVNINFLCVINYSDLTQLPSIE